jgi:hypothetical protein
MIGKHFGDLTHDLLNGHNLSYMSLFWKCNPTLVSIFYNLCNGLKRAWYKWDLVTFNQLLDSKTLNTLRFELLNKWEFDFWVFRSASLWLSHTCISCEKHVFIFLHSIQVLVFYSTWFHLQETSFILGMTFCCPYWELVMHPSYGCNNLDSGLTLVKGSFQGPILGKKTINVLIQVQVIRIWTFKPMCLTLSIEKLANIGVYMFEQNKLDKFIHASINEIFVLYNSCTRNSIFLLISSR